MKLVLGIAVLCTLITFLPPKFRNIDTLSFIFGIWGFVFTYAAWKLLDWLEFRKKNPPKEKE